MHLPSSFLKVLKDLTPHLKVPLLWQFYLHKLNKLEDQLIANQNFCVTCCLFPDLDQREATKLMHTQGHIKPA